MLLTQQISTPTAQPRGEARRHAVMLVGHGSLRLGSGASMIRLAGHLRAAGAAPITQAAFLNYTRPSVAEGVARCIARGADTITVLPYFLVPGWFVTSALPKQIRACQLAHPGVPIAQAAPLGDHPALARLVAQRAAEASQRHWQRPAPPHTALLMIAHGSPDGRNNRPIYQVAERVRASGKFAHVAVCFMDLNAPSIGAAVEAAVGDGAQRVIAVPYFLQMGNHVAEDLPQLVGEAGARFPRTPVVLAEHLGYDRALLGPLADRAADVQRMRFEVRK